MEAVEQIAVEQESLAERGMAAPEAIPLMARADLAALLAGSDVAVTG
jgi:hypothetical protein